MAILPINQNDNGDDHDGSIPGPKELMQKLYKMLVDVEAMEASQKFFLDYVSRLLAFQDGLMVFLPRVKAQIEKYAIDSENYNEEKLTHAKICREFVDIVKTRLKSCLLDGKLNPDHMLGLCEDLDSIQETMDILMKDLE